MMKTIIDVDFDQTFFAVQSNGRTISHRGCEFKIQILYRHSLFILT